MFTRKIYLDVAYLEVEIANGFIAELISLMKLQVTMRGVIDMAAITKTSKSPCSFLLNRDFKIYLMKRSITSKNCNNSTWTHGLRGFEKGNSEENQPVQETFKWRDIAGHAGINLATPEMPAEESTL